MTDPFLIDECLSPALVAYAHSRGHHATHVVFRGLQGTSDQDLMPVVLLGNFVFVTSNARDFLRLYVQESVHPGLVVIVPGNISAARQIALFERAIDILEAQDDLINRVLEIFADGTFEMRGWAASAD